MAIFLITFGAPGADDMELNALRMTLEARSADRVHASAWLLDDAGQKSATALRNELLGFVVNPSTLALIVVRIDHGANDGAALALTSSAQKWLAARRSRMPSGTQSGFA